jgi:2-keto-3-deoxy-L-rhamnonate aldolase RhmA
MIENTILKANREGRHALVFTLPFPSSQLIELAAHVGFDAISIDGEHGAYSVESVDEICRLSNALGMSVTARVPDNAAFQVNLFLDRGIQGVTGPHVETGAEAQALADACLFPEAGWRSWGGGRGTEFNDPPTIAKYGGQRAFMKWANENMIVMAQIESKKAHDNLDDILAVPGLTGVAGGPNDFAASMGLAGQPEHTDRAAATADVERRAVAAGKSIGINTFSIGVREFMFGQAREFCEENRVKPFNL